MLLTIHIIAAVIGICLVFGVLASAIRTVVVPRGESSLFTRAVFALVITVFKIPANEKRPYLVRDKWLARQAPTALVLLPFAWSIAVIISFWPIYWAFGAPGWDGLVISASSLTTLGFERHGTVIVDLTSALQALIGLGLVALMISFLPTIYSRFAEREQSVVQLSLLAGAPPDPVVLLTRAWDANAIDTLQLEWRDWETWFVDLGEAHTSFPALNFFRSQEPYISWVTTAGVVLDTAALSMCALEPPNRKGALMMRTGFDTLRQVADFFDIEYDPDPAPGDPISVRRDRFEELLDELESAGLPLRSDRDAIWKDWAGWRVNYDAVLVALVELTHSPPARLVNEKVVIADDAPVWWIR